MDNLAPLAEYSDYLKILWAILMAAGVGYFLYGHYREHYS